MATLDADGRLEGLPFMPEMARHCGRRFQVVKSAHKTCDPTGETNLRRMRDAVHLSTRCDGGAHDGCEARCLLFWKTAWLKPADGPAADSDPHVLSEQELSDIERLHAHTRYVSVDDSSIRYRCQATEIVRATTRLGSRDINQYFLDLASGNTGLWRFVSQLLLAAWDFGASRARGFLKRLPKPQARLSSAPPGQLQSEGDLALQSGEFVRVRPVREIALTLDSDGKNRRLSFEREMGRYSGKIFRVGYRPTQIIDERTGRKIRLGRDCIVLEGLVCSGRDNRGRLFCPRSSYFYWREAWLKRTRDITSNAPRAD